MTNGTELRLLREAVNAAALCVFDIEVARRKGYFQHAQETIKAVQDYQREHKLT